MFLIRNIGRPSCFEGEFKFLIRNWCFWGIDTEQV